MNGTSTISLAEAGRWLSGGTPSRDEPTYWAGDIPWIGSKDLRSFDLVGSSEHVSEDGAEAGSRIVEPGTVLFVTRGMSLAKEFRVGVAGCRLAFNQDIKAIVPRDGLSGRFLAWYLRSVEAYILDKCDTATHGTKRLPLERIDGLRVPLPSPSEQHRIATILDEADALRRKRQEALALLDQLLQSTFLEMFGDPVTNPRGWPLVALGKLTSGLRNGLSPATGGPIAGKVLTLAAITGKMFDPSQLKDAQFDRSPDPSQLVSKGLFLICRGNGNLDLVGRGRIASDMTTSTLYPDTIIACRPSNDAILDGYLEAVWQTRYVRAQIESAANTTNGTFKVNQRALESIQLPLPPRDRQATFVSFETGVGEIRSRLNSAIFGSEQLFASLLHRAFNGGL